MRFIFIVSLNDRYSVHSFYKLQLLNNIYAVVCTKLLLIFFIVIAIFVIIHVLLYYVHIHLKPSVGAGQESYKGHMLNLHREWQTVCVIVHNTHYANASVWFNLILSCCEVSDSLWFKEPRSENCFALGVNDRDSTL